MSYFLFIFEFVYWRYILFSYIIFWLHLTILLLLLFLPQIISPLYPLLFSLSLEKKSGGLYYCSQSSKLNKIDGYFSHLVACIVPSSTTRVNHNQEWLSFQVNTNKFFSHVLCLVFSNTLATTFIITQTVLTKVEKAQWLMRIRGR